jgi:CubicO group peptidase (beta-lactamase class C family)
MFYCRLGPRQQKKPGPLDSHLSSMVTHKALCVSVLTLCATVLVQAQNGSPASVDSLASIAESAFKATRCPGLSVAVAKNNVMVYSGAFGFADIEQRLVLRTDSAHRLASLSKPVTGTIIMDLVQLGRLKLDTPIKTYLTVLPTAYDKVTIRHLLSHQAGVRDYRNDEEVFNEVHYPTSRDAIEIFVNDALLFESGTKMAYSNFGFTMLGAVAEAATGETFQNLSKDFFRRYNLRGFDIDDPLTIVPKRVRGYHVDEDGLLSNTRAYDASNKYPAGGFTSSAEDYLRFAIAVGSGQVLRPEILNQTWADQHTRDERETHYGLGWGVSELEGRKMVGFNGLSPSTTTSARYFPVEGVGIVALCNAEVVNSNGDQDLSDLLNAVLKVVLPDNQ